ncbi:type II secretion system protein GspN [uncultured Desulfovibrio sp.]|uniref:type II secretion system protein GspN n=1 Tax=uncultured Desulfovibrio sp. TaxID=167968 RepID=UPI0026243666|nr:type II secretion system protein GspN [uncultured Desulfovibrio sp.]
MKVFDAIMQVKELLSSRGIRLGWRPSMRHVLYLVLFLGSWTIFFAYSYGYRLLEAQLATALNKGTALGIQVDSPVLEGLIPTFSAREIILDTEPVRLSLTQVKADLHLFPLHVTATCRLAGGSVSLRLEPASMSTPFPLRVQGDLKNVSLPDIVSGIRRELPVAVNGGKLDLSLDISATGMPRNANALSGKVRLSLAEGRLRHGLPLLRMEELANVRGRLELALSAGNANIESLRVESGDIALEASGKLRLASKPSQTALDLRATLALPPAQVERELLPKRTRQQLETNGKVLFRIGGTFASPSPSLMEQ